MPRNDRIDQVSVRNVNLTATQISNTQRHNEREKESYVNPDIMPERTKLNVHFKQPTNNYAAMFEQIKNNKIISTRELKADAHLFGELIFNVNSIYFITTTVMNLPAAKSGSPTLCLTNEWFSVYKKPRQLSC